MLRNYLNAIIYCSEPEGLKRQNFLKYHTIKNTDEKKAKFCKFAAEKFKSAEYVNFYDKTTETFLERIYLK